MNLTDRQREIIDAAIRIISEGGIQELTIRTLGKRIGISEAAIYRHFDNKTHILLTILDQFQEEVEQSIGAIRKSHEPGLVQLETLFMNRARMLSRKPYYARVIFAEEIFQNEESLSRKVREIMKTQQSVLEDILEKAARNGEIPNEIPFKQFCIMVMGSFRLLVTRWRIAGYDFNLEDEVENFFKYFKKLVKGGEHENS